MLYTRFRTTSDLAGLTQLEEMMAPIEAILAKKAENRPLTPEEYDQLSKFTDKVEHRTAALKIEKNA